MNKLALPLLLASLLMTITSTCFADDHANKPQHRSYGAKIGIKALHGVTNISTAILEIPKNIINTTNNSNLFYGVTGGFFKGIVNVIGRTGVGLFDLITFPMPTKEAIYPAIVWDDFDADTRYGEVARLNY